MRDGKILEITCSEKKGAPKKRLAIANVIQDFGLEGDLHAGKEGRQVSFMGIETFRVIRESEGKGYCTNKFVANITTENIELWKLTVGTELQIGETIMVVTQVGKECFRGCPLREQEGSCIMLNQVVFADVRRGGKLAIGDTIKIIKAPEALKLNTEEKGREK